MGNFDLKLVKLWVISGMAETKLFLMFKEKYPDVTIINPGNIDGRGHLVSIKYNFQDFGGHTGHTGHDGRGENYEEALDRAVLNADPSLWKHSDLPRIQYYEEKWSLDEKITPVSYRIHHPRAKYQSEHDYEKLQVKYGVELMEKTQAFLKSYGLKDGDKIPIDYDFRVKAEFKGVWSEIEKFRVQMCDL